MINYLNCAFYLYLKKIFSLEKNIINLNKIHDDLIEKIVNQQILNNNFLSNYYIENNKYPFDYKPIINLGKYDILKIYNAYSSNPKYLLASINNNNVLNLKPTFDDIPVSKINIDFELQNLFNFDFLNNILEHKKILDPIKTSLNESFLFKQFDNVVFNTTKNISFSVNYAIYQYISVNLNFLLKTQEKIQPIINSYTDSVNYRHQQSFNRYLNDHINDISNNLAKFILFYIYNITSPAGSFLSEIEKVIQDWILNNFKKIYNEYLKNQENLFLNNSSNIIYVLYNKLAEICTEDLCNSTVADQMENIVNKNTNDILFQNEINKYNSLIEKITPNNFKQYLYLVFYYNKTPLKFLNILQLILDTYTNNEIITSEKSNYTEDEIISYFNLLYGSKSKYNTDGLNFDFIHDTLINIINKDLINSILIDDYVISYGFRSNMLYYTDNFLNNFKEYDNSIDDLLNNIFIYLQSSVNISYEEDYFKNKDLLKLFFKSYLHKDILNGKIFLDIENEMYEIFDIYTSNLSQITIDSDKMRNRVIQLLNSNISKIHYFYESILKTSILKYLHDTNIVYYLNNNIK